MMDKSAYCLDVGGLCSSIHFISGNRLPNKLPRISGHIGREKYLLL